MFQGLRLLASSNGHVMVTKMKDQYRFTQKKTALAVLGQGN
jgi:hypothetical protein